MSAGVVFGLTSFAKLWTSFGDVKLLAVADPIVGVSFKHLMLVVAIAELAIAGVCLFTKAHRMATMLVAWIATNFLVYRIGLWWMGWKKPCGCLGNLTDDLHISPHTADIIIKVLLAYLLIGSYGLLIWEWRGRRAAKMDGGGLKIADTK
jgi:hypothetical protein